MFINIHFPEIFNQLSFPRKNLGYTYGQTKSAEKANMVERFCKQKDIPYILEVWKDIFYFEFPEKEL